ncbi:MAG: molecular chaperone DnaJ [Myxococcota bacterium]
MPRDYYEILEVERGAAAEEIKRAYKKAAKKAHPDLNKDDPDAERKFKEVAEAYDVLSDEQKRRVYDQYGHDGLKSRGFAPDFNASNVQDIFEQIFGGGFADLFGGGGGGRRGPRRGADLEYPLRLDFMEAAHGVTKKISVPRRIECVSCRGNGVKDGAKPAQCTTCGGQGQVISAQGFLRIRTACPSCRGQGTVIRSEDRCPSCSGNGRVRETKEMEVRIPAGSYSGLQIKHTGAGEAGEPGGESGDLYVTLEVLPHDVFKRDGADVYVTVPVPYEVMCLGGAISVPTVYGEQTVDLPRGTANGHVVVLGGKGLEMIRTRGRKGDQHVRLVVEVPTKLSEEQEEIIRKLADLRGTGVHGKGFWQNLFEKFTGS